MRAFQIEDTNDISNSYYLGSNYGGQNYDGEFLGGAVFGSKLYLAILTGQRPDNGFSGSKGLYSPGDIRIETSTGASVSRLVAGTVDGAVNRLNYMHITAASRGRFFWSRTLA